MKKAFGGYTIVPDENLSVIVGTDKAITPAEMTKAIWKYIKKHKLGGK